MAPLRVQCCSFNGHLNLGHPGNDPADPSQDLASWLVPTLTANPTPSAPPDIIALGFQEMIPGHLSLAGFSSAALDLHDHALRSAIEKVQDESYTLVAKKVIGGIALLVYTRDATITAQVADIRLATVGCGIGGVMGNKGAVGIRIALQEEDSEEESQVFTFVTAHLAAHDSGLQRRNEDWRSIVRRLVFARDAEVGQFRPRRKLDVFKELSKDKAVQGLQMYDTSSLFFFGDLNYRISTVTPSTLPLSVLSTKLSTASLDLPSLLAHDQLHHEQSLDRTLHHLREGEITFKPTYKYIPGTVDKFKSFKKRVPGWCDRVLFATWDGAEKSVGGDGAKIEVYTSVPSFTRSDHKPVTAIISLPQAPKNSPSPLRLPFQAPFPIDPLWRRKQLIGRLLDRTIGILWCLVMFAGFGKDARLGIITLSSAAFAAWWKGYLF